MEAKELRIGNIIAIEGTYCTVNSIHLVPQTDEVHIRVSGYIENNPQHCIFNYDASPIPLTPALLEKCGFIRTVTPMQSVNYIDYRKGNMVCFTLPDGLVEVEYSGLGIEKRAYLTKIKYLHQLQNLYFALTGEELEVNL